jgi:predicted dehydrogenase
MQQKVRWAVVGTSDFALDWIARGIRLGSNSELAAVVSRDPDRAAAAAQRVGAARSFQSIDTIDPAVVDGVFLVLPNGQHAPRRSPRRGRDCTWSVRSPWHRHWRSASR